MEKVAICPRCMTEMEYMTEVARGSEGKKIFMYYRCPACSFRLLDEAVTVKLENGSVIVRATLGERRPRFLVIG